MGGGSWIATGCRTLNGPDRVSDSCAVDDEQAPVSRGSRVCERSRAVRIFTRLGLATLGKLTAPRGGLLSPLIAGVECGEGHALLRVVGDSQFDGVGVG
jgi:hypothetical protein